MFLHKQLIDYCQPLITRIIEHIRAVQSWAYLEPSSYQKWQRCCLALLHGCGGDPWTCRWLDTH